MGRTPREGVDIAKPGSPFLAFSQYIVSLLDDLFAPSGHRIEWSRVSREMMYHTSELSFRGGDSSGLAAAISTAIVKPSDERSAFVSQARDAMRAAKTTILTSAIEEQPTRTGAILSGRVIAADGRYVALATGPRAFAVLCATRAIVT